ncbi:MAG TPA: RsbRD N-terminal domain-containing protein [Anaeromyxobacter sp.]
MTLADLLSERQDALCGRWLDAILAGYGEPTASRWRREKDPFRNPVGHTLATGLPALVAAVSRDAGLPEDAATALEAIVRIRSVQDLAPSRAVGFVWLLRDAIRAEIGEELSRAHAEELAQVERRIERLGLEAFDTYVALREQVFRLRQEELKRSVASILRRWHGGQIPEPGAEDLAQLSPPRDAGARR